MARVSGLPLPFRFHVTSVVGTAGRVPGSVLPVRGRAPPAPEYDRRGARADQRHRCDATSSAACATPGTSATTGSPPRSRRCPASCSWRTTPSATALDDVYRDDAIVTRRDPATGRPTSSSSQPAIMARMLEMLGVGPGDRVLEIGAGHRLQRRPARPPRRRRRGRHVGRAGRRRRRRRPAGPAGRPGRRPGSRWATAPPGGRRPPPSTRSSPPPASTASRAPGSTSSAPAGGWWCPLRLSPVVSWLQAVAALRKVRTGFDPVAVTGGGVHAAARPRRRRAAGEAARLAVGEVADGGPGRSHVELTGPALAGPRPRRPPAPRDDRARLRPPAARAARRRERPRPAGLRGAGAARGAAGRGRARRRPGRSAARRSASSTRSTAAWPCWCPRPSRVAAARRLRRQRAPSGACSRRSSGGSWPAARRSPTPASPCATARCARTAGTAPAAATSGSPSTGPGSRRLAVVPPSGVSPVRDRVLERRQNEG